MPSSEPSDPFGKHGGNDRVLPEMEARHGRPSRSAQEAGQSADFSLLKAFQPDVARQVPAIYLIEREAIRLRRQRRQEVQSSIQSPIPKTQAAPSAAPPRSDFQGAPSAAPPLAMYSRPVRPDNEASTPATIPARIRRFLRRLWRAP